MLRWVLAAGMLIAIPAVASAQDAEAGKKVFAKYCSPCHNIGPGAKNKVGPELNGIDGRKSGTAEGYNYTEANKNSGITWSEAELTERPAGQAPQRSNRIRKTQDGRRLRCNERRWIVEPARNSPSGTTTTPTRARSS